MAQTATQNVLQEVSPASAQLMPMIFGFMTTQAISTAAKLGVADLLKDGPKTADDLARETGTHAPSLYRMLRALASVGIFAEDASGRFSMTTLAASLRSDAPDSLRDFAIYMGADFHWRVWGGLPYSVETGQPAFENIFGREAFGWLQENEEPARIFNNAMTSLSQMSSRAVADAYDFSSIRRLVDIGGGHGYLLASILHSQPRMKGVLFDAPHVVEGAHVVIGAQGVAERCELASGDFFQSVPAGGDAYIMKHIIHDWEDERALKILRNCHQSMTGDGRLLVVEIVIPESNQPSPGKFLDLEMLLFLHSHERTEDQYRELYERAGFRLTRIVPTGTPYSIIEGVKA